MIEILAVLASAVACGAVIYTLWHTSATQQQEIEEQDKRLNQQYLLELDDALENWLSTLELPIFEERTRRVAAARQLSTVLIEKLWRTRCPDRISRAD